MRVLHIIPAYPPATRYGGPMASVHPLNKALVDQGAEVTVYTTAKDGDRLLDLPMNVPIDRDGVSVHYFAPSAPRRWFYSSAMRRALAAHTREFDVVHITSVFLAPSALGAHYAREHGTPYLISPRGSLMTRPLASKALKKEIYLQWIERRNLRDAAAIHFSVEREKEEYLTAGLPLRDAAVIPNSFDPATLPGGAIDGSFRKKHGIPRDAFLVLFLGRVNWIKGLDTLIPAFARVASRIPGAVLAIAGEDDGGYEPQARKLVDDHGIAARVVFCGPVLGAEKTAAFRESDLFAMPSYSESFGMSAVEAMSCGVPVLVTDGVGIAPEIARAGAGVVVPKTESSCADAIERMCAMDRPARMAMGERGKRLVAEEFSIVAVARRFLMAYNQAIQNHPPR